MSKTFNTIFAIALVSIFPALTIYTGLQTQNYTEDQAILLATKFLENSPTFKFDGLEETIKVVKVDTLRMPNTWLVTIEFDSSHAGYGDRTGDMLAQVITSHTMEITVSNGKVISAVTDQVFDEVSETLVPVDTGAEGAEDIAVEWLMNAPTYSFDGISRSIHVVETVIAESYPVQYFITIEFQCAQPGYGDRTGEILAQVITDHTARITVIGGVVTNAVIDGTWDEINQVEKGESEILQPEDAIKVVVVHLKENYSEAESLEITGDWSIANKTPEDILGASVIEYTGDGWNITLRYPVVWKPTYSITVENSSGFTWSGTVDQSRTVEKTQ